MDFFQYFDHQQDYTNLNKPKLLDTYITKGSLGKSVQTSPERKFNEHRTNNLGNTVLNEEVNHQETISSHYQNSYNEKLFESFQVFTKDKNLSDIAQKQVINILG